MAVLIEGVSIVVRIATIKARHDGGLEDFFEWISGFRYCYDDHLVAVHFKRNRNIPWCFGKDFKIIGIMGKGHECPDRILGCLVNSDSLIQEDPLSFLHSLSSHPGSQNRL